MTETETLQTPIAQSLKGNKRMENCLSNLGNTKIPAKFKDTMSVPRTKRKRKRKPNVPHEDTLLRRLRSILGWSGAEVAGAIDNKCSQATISSWENRTYGIRPERKQTLLALFSTALNKDFKMEDLFDDENKAALYDPVSFNPYKDLGLISFEEPDVPVAEVSGLKDLTTPKPKKNKKKPKASKRTGRKRGRPTNAERALTMKNQEPVIEMPPLNGSPSRTSRVNTLWLRDELRLELPTDLTKEEKQRVYQWLECQG